MHKHFWGKASSISVKSYLFGLRNRFGLIACSQRVFARMRAPNKKSAYADKRGPQKCVSIFGEEERQPVKRNRDLQIVLKANRGEPKGLAATWCS